MFMARRRSVALKQRIIINRKEYNPMNNEDKKYNGWRNYATWRINLEIVHDYVQSTVYDDAQEAERWAKELELNELADELKEYVEEAVTEYGELNDNLAVSYALAFVDDVDFYELAEHAREHAQQALKAFDEDDALAATE